jgi:hypothetical protein
MLYSVTYAAEKGSINISRNACNYTTLKTMISVTIVEKMQLQCLSADLASINGEIEQTVLRPKPRLSALRQAQHKENTTIVQSSE